MKSDSGVRLSLLVLACVLILFLLAGNGWAFAQAKPQSNVPPEIVDDRLVYGDSTGNTQIWVERSSLNVVELAARSGSLQIGKTELQGVPYLTFSEVGLGKGDKIGLPDLPVLRRDVEIPFGAQVSLELVSSTYTEVKLVDLGLPAEILPLQPSQPKCGDPVAPCQPDAKVYQQDAFFPALPLALGNEYVVRGHRAQTVELWPVAYNPVQGTVRLYSELRFQIRLQGAQAMRTLSESARLASPAFEDTLSNRLLNYNLGQGARAVQEMAPVNYLIITADAYYEGLADFVVMKEAQGFSVTVAKTSVIGSTTSEIKNYITSQYNGATPPSYVLLVGDHNDGTDSIPAWAFPGYGSYYTDLYYVTMDGSSDYVPDIYRGRFPVRDTSQLANMVQNNLWYANDVSGTEAWVKKAAYLATDDGPHYSFVEGTHNYCVSTYTQPKGYTGIFPANPQPGGDKLYAITYLASTTQVVSALNDGRVMAVYSGHGSQTYWAGPSVSQTNVRNLTGNPIPYVVGHACVTADYNTAEAFSDTWVIQNGKGALVYVGASNNSYWDEDDKLQRVMFDTFYDPAPGDPSIAQMLYTGLGAVQSTYPSSAKYYWEEYNLFGDPSLVIVTGPRDPDFTLTADPGQAAICATGSATSTISVGSLLGFATPVDLSLAGAPAGVSSGFDPATVLPASYSILTLTHDGTAAAGVYSLTVSGSTATLTHTTQVDLGIFTGGPGAPALQTPVNGAIDQSDLPTLTWQSAQQAATHTLQVATDAGFENLVVNKTGITGTSYTLATALNTGTKYYWRVVAHNVCGSGTPSEVFDFTTTVLPGDCSPEFVTQTLHFTDLENGLNGWTDASTGSYHWATSTVMAKSPTHSVLGEDVTAISDQRLVSPALLLFSGDTQPVTFSFWQWHAFEGSLTSCIDGGILELSADGGLGWSQVSAMPGTYDYNGTISSYYDNPLAGKSAWCYVSSGWQRTVVDLSAYAGQTVQLRFRLGTDSSISSTGWYVDDLRVQTCVPKHEFMLRFPLVFR
jgi:hypothetical protein